MEMLETFYFRVGEAHRLSFTQMALARHRSSLGLNRRPCLRIEFSLGLDSAVLRCAIDEIVTRHAALRTVYRTDTPNAFQWSLPVENTATNERDWQVSKSNREHLCAHFEIDKVEGQARKLSVSIDTLAIDRFSLDILLADLMTAYSAAKQGRKVLWPSPAPSYRRFVEFQSTLFDYENHKLPAAKSVLARQLRFWNRNSKGAPSMPLSEFCVGKCRSNSFDVSIPESTVRRIRELAANRRVTFEILVRAAIAFAYHREEDADDIVFRIRASGRLDPGFETAVGRYEQPLLARYSASAFIDSISTIEHVRERDLELLRYPYLPMAHLWSLRPGNEPPLVHASVTMTSAAPNCCQFEGGTARLLSEDFEEGHSHLDVELWPEDTDCGIQGQIFVCSTRFTFDKAKRIWNRTLDTLSSWTVGTHTALGKEFSISPRLHRGDYVPPADPLQMVVTNICEEVLGTIPVGLCDNLAVLTQSANGLEELRSVISTRLRLNKPPHVIDAETVETICRQLSDMLPAERITLIRSERESLPPLIILHGDFNSGGYYCNRLADSLRYPGAIYALHPHGLREEAIPDSIDEMAEDFFHSLVKALPTFSACALLGHCNGGLIAFELARQLVSSGRAVTFLGIIHAQYFRPGTALASTSPAQPATPKSARHSRIMRFDHYRRAMLRFAPQRYSGSLDVFWPMSEPYGTVMPDLAWGAVASDTRLHSIHGNHLSSITTFAAELARLIDTCIEMREFTRNSR